MPHRTRVAESQGSGTWNKFTARWIKGHFHRRGNESDAHDRRYSSTRIRWRFYYTCVCTVVIVWWIGDWYRSLRLGFRESLVEIRDTLRSGMERNGPDWCSFLLQQMFAVFLYNWSLFFVNFLLRKFLRIKYPHHQPFLKNLILQFYTRWKLIYFSFQLCFVFCYNSQDNPRKRNISFFLRGCFSLSEWNSARK